MGSISSKSSLKQDKYSQLQHYIAANHLKWTRQRDIISKIFFSGPHRHYRLEEILEKCRETDSTISYATVYRTLMMLVEAGLAFQRQFGKGQSLFESISDHHHDHLICTQCGDIVEFENQTIEKLQEMVVKKHGFKLVHHKMELYGVCNRCRK